MHESVMAWVAQQVDARGIASRSTLEVGSYDVNGSVRPLFSGGYVGIDHAPGPGVDEVANACLMPFGDCQFETVVSTEMLEHCDMPWRAVEEMHRVLAVDGVAIVTCRGFDERGSFPFHNPPDNYRFSAYAMVMMFTAAGFGEIVVERDPQVPGWFVTATKSPDPTSGSAPGTAT